MTDPVESLRRQVEQELVRLGELLGEAGKAPEPDDTWRRRAVASMLHDFYTCCERIFRGIALDLDGYMPQEPGWHRRLLSMVASPVEGVRPAVISKDLASTLDEYLGFRHVFRNVYGFELEGARLLRLLASLDTVGKRVEDEVRRFLESLEAEGKG